MGRTKNDDLCASNWAELHPAMLMLIFLKMGTMELLTIAASVCHSWRKVATEEPELWRRINMATDGYSIDASTLMYLTRQAIYRSKGRLEEFSMQYLGDDLLRYLCDSTGVLKKLCLMSCYHLSQDVIAEIVKRLPLLEDLEIKDGCSVDRNMTEIIGKECPQLKSFKFSTTWFWFSVPPIDDSEALGIANNMHELRHLQLIGNRMTNWGLEAILDGCPFLETLDIRRCFYVTLDDDITARCARVKTIRLPEDVVVPCV